MTKYLEILRLKSLGFSERNIAHSCGVSRNTVAKVTKKATEMNLSWPLDFDMHGCSAFFFILLDVIAELGIHEWNFAA